VHALDDVTAVVEHTADVLSVHSAGEVRIAIVAPISTSSADSLWGEKLIADEVLGPGHAWILSRLGSRFLHTILRSSVARKLWEVVLDLRFPSEDFLSKQVLLVEEQDHRDGATPVVPDALEEVQSLLQAVGLVVLPNDHVVAAAGHHEDDGSHCVLTVEALDPLAALIALAAHIEHAVDFVHLELGLKDSRGQDAAAKQKCAYLVTWHIVGLLDDINLVQELVLIGALVAGTHSFVLPQSLGMWEVKVRHVHHAQNVVHSELVLRVGQLHRGHQVSRGLGTYFNGLLQVVFDVLHFGGLLTTVELKRKRKENHIASCPPGVSP
uniref:Predicted gene, 20721 n=1 Tax=Jaculus jaculus TaxID=51337 RepID=A0A8C5KV84_JACJA